MVSDNTEVAQSGTKFSHPSILKEKIGTKRWYAALYRHAARLIDAEPEKLGAGYYGAQLGCGGEYCSVALVDRVADACTQGSFKYGYCWSAIRCNSAMNYANSLSVSEHGLNLHTLNDALFRGSATKAPKVLARLLRKAARMLEHGKSFTKVTP